MTDDDIWRLQRGGHDAQKVFNAYKRAVEHTGRPTVILAKTVKGYGLGTAQARNATHQEKKLTDEALAAFRMRFEIPIPEKAAHDGSPYCPPSDSPEHFGASASADLTRRQGKSNFNAQRPTLNASIQTGVGRWALGVGR